MLCRCCNINQAHPVYGDRCEDCFADSVDDPSHRNKRSADCRPRNVAKDIEQQQPDEYEAESMRAEGIYDGD